MTKEKFSNWIEVEDYLSSLFVCHRDVAIFNGLDEFQAQRLMDKSVEECLTRLSLKNCIPTQEQCLLISEIIANIWF